jgi:tetratricopeptide (TPR) repeat protein
MDFLANDSKNLINKGNLLAELGHFKESAECYASALESDPDNPEALLNLGKLLIKFDRFSDAILCYNQILTTDSKNSVAWQQKGLALLQLNKPEEALTCIDTALSINDTLKITWYRKGIVLDHLERLDEAIFCYDKCLKNPEGNFYFSALWNKIINLDKLGRMNESNECFDKYDREFTIHPFFKDSLDLIESNPDTIPTYSDEGQLASEVEFDDLSGDLDSEYDSDFSDDEEMISESDTEDIWCPNIGGVCAVEEIGRSNCPYGECAYREFDEFYDENDFENSTNSASEDDEEDFDLDNFAMNYGEAYHVNDNIYPPKNSNVFLNTF